MTSFVSNTPFIIGSGSFSVDPETIGTQLSKAITCVTAGVIYVPTSVFRQTPAEAAYGEWAWWQYKLAAGQVRVGFGADPVPYNAGNYVVISDTDESLILSEVGVGTVITSGTDVTAGAWQKIKLTRSRLGAFELFLDGTSVGTGTDATIASADYFGVAMLAGDKIAYSDLKGEHSVRKGLFG